MELEKERAYDWMQRLSRSLIRFETQDIKTQPLFNHFLSLLSLSFYIFLFSFYKPKPFCKEININQLLKEFQKIGELLLNKVHRNMNASWKICSLAVNGQSFLVIDGYLLNSCMKRSHFSNNITPSLGFLDTNRLSILLFIISLLISERPTLRSWRRFINDL